jgi:hypothetical protein
MDELMDYGYGDIIDGKCSKCGHVMESGDYPFCPHGKTRTLYINRDEIPGGITLENYGPQPVTFYSHSERRRYMEAHGIREKEKFSPARGTDKDPAGIPNPKGYMDPQTLENARILLTRVKGAKDPNATTGVLVNLQTQIVADRDAMTRAVDQKTLQEVEDAS